LKTSAWPCCCARLDCAVQISSSPFSKGIALRTAPPAPIGALVGKRIRWSAKCPKNMKAKYARPNTSNPHPFGTILGLTSLQPTKHMKEIGPEGDEQVFCRSRRRLSWIKDNCDVYHCCCCFGRKRDMIASSTITTNSSAPPQMKRETPVGVWRAQ